MTEIANKQVFGYDQCKDILKLHYDSQINLLKDIFNYGTNLVLRILGGPSNDIEHFIVISILLKHIISMLDSIEIQISNCQIFGANLQVRSLFETSLFIEWILKKDTLNRVKYYYVFYYRNELIFLNKFINQYKSDKNFAQKFERTKKRFKDPPEDLIKMAKIEIDNLIKILNNPIYSDIYNQFNKLKSGRPIHWYTLTNVDSIRDLSDKLGVLDQYIIFYNNFSKIMHGSVIREHVNFDDDKILLKPVRELFGIDVILNTTISFTLRVYLLIINKYRPGEIEVFKKLYRENWRSSFLSIKRTVYK